MINKMPNSELVKLLAGLRKELEKKTKEMEAVSDPNLRRLIEITCKSIRTQIANLENKIQPENGESIAIPTSQLEKTPPAEIAKFKDHIAKIAHINDSIQKCDEKIAGLKQINATSQKESKQEMPQKKIVSELTQNEDREISDLDIPVIAVHLHKPPKSPPPLSQSPVKNENDMLKKASEKALRKISESKVESNNPESEQIDSLNTDETEILPKSLPPAIEELKQVLQIENEYSESDIDSDPIQNMNEQEAPKQETIQNEEPEVISSADPIDDSNITKNEIDLKEDSDSTSSMADRVSKSIREAHYQIFHFQPQNSALKTALAHFNFVALKTTTNVPFYKDIYMDLLFVKVIPGQDTLILDRNIDAVQFESNSANESEDLPSPKIMVLDPLAAYLSLHEAFKRISGTPSDEDNIFLALANLLNVKFQAGQWLYRQKSAHIHIQFLSITEQPVKFAARLKSTEIKSFAGFPEVQAYYLSELELLRYMEYTQAKYKALFGYNKKNVDAQLPQPVTIQYLKYKMLFNACVGVLLLASSVVVCLTSDPRIYWGLFIGLVSLIAGLYLAIKIWDLSQRMQIHAQFIHHTWSAFSPSEVQGLINQIVSESFKTALTEELRTNPTIKTGFSNKLQKCATLTHKSVTLSKKKSPTPSPIKAQVLNKNQLIQDFLSE